MPDPAPSDSLTPSWDRTLLSGLTRFIFKSSGGDPVLTDVVTQFNGMSILPHIRKMLTNIMGLKDLVVSDIMHPLADIVAIEASANLTEVIEKFKGSEHSRLPVYRESLDDPIGFIHIKDLMDILLRTPEQQELFLAEHIVRDLMFVPRSIPVLDLMIEMQAKRLHLALIVDEYGGTDGLVTIEDLVEQIVGRIDDEHDTDEEKPLIIIRPNGVIDVDGRTELVELVPHLETVVDLDSFMEHVDTINGLVTAHAGRVPQRGEILTFSPSLEFHILEADPRRIRRLRLVRTNMIKEETPLEKPV
jgi:magnesium and cobalt transporter